MNYCKIKTHDASNGPGVRVSIFVSGCRRHCKGCFNPDTWDFNSGVPFTDETVRFILEKLSPEYISGLSILGGEPLEKENQSEVLGLINAVRDKFGFDKTIWLWTGFTLCSKDFPVSCFTPEIISKLDAIVDGPFIESKFKPGLKFRGSENQRIIIANTSLVG